MSEFKNWENFNRNFKDKLEKDTSLKLQYAILYKKYDEIFNVVLTDELLKKKIQHYNNDTKALEEIDILTIKDCLVWNYGYINKALEKQKSENTENSENINEWKKYFDNLNKDTNNELDYYTDIVYQNKNIFELFFNNEQPMLDVKYYEQQEEPAKKLYDYFYHLIFDEVGTGKTVSALYCIRNVLNSKKDNSKILIVCPNNKKTEWKDDIKRQLGRYAHIVENSDESEIYSLNKDIFFRNNEAKIFIEGQKKGEMKYDCNSYNPKNKWDLIIIDEGHICFSNYNSLKSEKAVLMTATPIVANNSDEVIKYRPLDCYQNLLKTITETEFNNDENNLENLFSKNDVFTQLFREDLGLIAKNRKIEFLECERWDKDKREKYLNILANVKGGMTKLIYEQDDDYLIYGVFNKFKKEIENAGYNVGDEPKIKNNKLTTLIDFLSKNENNSYIVFCNYRFTADNVYKIIADEKLVKTIIIKKYGSTIDTYPKDNKITKDNAFQYMSNLIDNGKRVVFITTGASGGTGLNLGMFDGVINYELPFTCIELEQRFGRVDRMNSKTATKDMIFILNNDMNPMLRYSVSKINATCLFMPIRNTILFYPQFITANIKSLKNELKLCNVQNDVIDVIIDVKSERDKFYNNDDKKKIEEIEKVLIKKENLQGFDIGSFSEEVSEYANLLNKNKEQILKYYKCKRKLEELVEEINDFAHLLGVENEIITEDYDSIQIAIDDNDNDDDNDKDIEEYTQDNENIIGNSLKIIGKKQKAEIKLFDENEDTTIQNKIENLEATLKNLSENGKISNVSGIFYITTENGKVKYVRQTVENYREEFNNDARDKYSRER